jgi:hypothetical protein
VAHVGCRWTVGRFRPVRDVRLRAVAAGAGRDDSRPRPLCHDRLRRG